MSFAVSSALIHFPSETAPKRYPLRTSTIGCKSAAGDAPAQINKAARPAKVFSSVAFMIYASPFVADHLSKFRPFWERKIAFLEHNRLPPLPDGKRLLRPVLLKRWDSPHGFFCIVKVAGPNARRAASVRGSAAPR